MFAEYIEFLPTMQDHPRYKNRQNKKKIIVIISAMVLWYTIWTQTYTYDKDVAAEYVTTHAEP